MFSRIHPAFVAVAWVGAVLLLGAVPAGAQFDFGAKHISFTAKVGSYDPFSESNSTGGSTAKPQELNRGELFLLSITATPEKNWYSYPFTRRAPDQPAGQMGKMTVVGNDGFQALPASDESAGEFKQYGDEVYLIHPKPFTITWPIYIQPSASPGAATLKIKLNVQVCYKSCIQEEHVLDVPVTISASPPVPASPALTNRLAAKAPPPTIEPLPEQFKKPGLTPPAPGTNVSPTIASKPKTPSSLWGSIVRAVVGGYISLLTPCVFPMIPITVSYFLKQSEAGRSATLAMATVYCGTLVLVLALGGLVLMNVLVAISVHWVTNFLLGVVFLFFALSLLGMYDITLPAWLQDATAAGEGKGGLVGVFFMALTFSIVSFACVGPIYGGFISVEATSSTSAGGHARQVLPVVAFSAAFASPFFLLAMFPTLLRSMPRAGSWMNSVKVVMGFLELAAVVKFVRAAELSLTRSSNYFTFDFSLGLYVALSLACALYLLALYRLPHDHDMAESVGVPRLMFSLVFLTLAVYLAPGLMKNFDGDAQRPRGTVFAWVESFLLPDTDGVKPTGKSAGGQQLVWGSKLKDALAQAEREKKLVFLDFTGMLCTNCKLNERNIFTRPEVQAALGKHVLLKLYTDYVPAGVEQLPSAEDAYQLRNRTFGTNALPLYALLRPKGDTFEIVRQDEQGLIEDVPAFVKFLTD